MSVEAQKWVWEQVATPAQKLVLMALANRADEVGVCFPGQQGIAERCGIKQRALQYHLAELTKIGLLSSEPRFRKDGSRTSNLYRLSMQEPAPPGIADSVQEVAESEGSVQNLAPPSADIDVGVAQDSASPSAETCVGILELSSNYQEKGKEEEEYIRTPDWLKLLRDIEEWHLKGRPHEASLQEWVYLHVDKYTSDQLEGSAIGLGATQAKTLKGYKRLDRAFQRRLREGYDDPARQDASNNGYRPVGRKKARSAEEWGVEQ